MESDTTAMPAVVDRGTFQAELDALRVREKAHTREGDAIAAARRRLPMVEVDANLALTGPDGPVTLLDEFEGRRQLIAYYHMWYSGWSAPEQCEGCTWVTSQVSELSYLRSRDITYAVFCQGPYDESVGYDEFMDYRMPWYSAHDSLDTLLVGRSTDRRFSLVCYLRRDDRVFETYWTAGRGAEVLDYNYALMDLTVVRTPGAVGGLAGRLATAVAAGRRRRDPHERRSQSFAGAALLARLPPHRPVVAARSRTLGRPRRRGALAAGGTMHRMTKPWMIEERDYAGAEHLNDAFVAAYDRKQQFDPSADVAALADHGLGRDSTLVDLGAGTGTFALAAAATIGRVVAVDVSVSMVHMIGQRAEALGVSNVERVEAGLLSYEHTGPAPDAMYTRNVLHQLPDFWKGVALERIAAGAPIGWSAVRARPRLRLPPVRSGGGPGSLVRRGPRRSGPGVHAPRSRGARPHREQHVPVAVRGDPRDRRVRDPRRGVPTLGLRGVHLPQALRMGTGVRRRGVPASSCSRC